MFSFLTTAIRILYPDDGTLIVQFPVDVFPSIVLGILGVALAIICIFLIKWNGFRPWSFFLLAGFIPIALFFYVVTQSSTLIFSGKDNTVVLEESAFFRMKTTTYPIASVEHVEVAEDDGRSHVFYIALHSGDRIPVGGGWTTRSGYFQAANAANQFLAQGRGDAAPVSDGSAPAMDYEKKMQESSSAEFSGWSAPVQPVRGSTAETCTGGYDDASSRISRSIPFEETGETASARCAAG